jgi:hypothetical protein
MHDTVEENLESLPLIVAALRGEGYQLVTLPELFGGEIPPGQAIYNGPRASVPEPDPSSLD